MLNNLAGRIRRATYSGEKGNELSSTNTTANSRRLTDAAAVNHVPEVYFPPPPDPAPLPSTIQSSKSTLYLIYDNANPPPKRSGATRFVCISDTHSQQFAVPDGDVLLHSGDLTSRGKKANFEETLDWLISLPHKIKIIIAGNHDLPLHKDWYHENYERFVHHRHEKEDSDEILALFKSDRARAAGIVYLQDELYQFQVAGEGRMWSIYGSPWQPYFGGWAFNYKEDEAEGESLAIVSKLQKCDILLTHGPPHLILDYTLSHRNAGCPTLAARLSSLRPRLHVFGHIHEDHGAVIKAWPKPSSKRTIFRTKSASSLRPTTPSLLPSGDHTDVRRKRRSFLFVPGLDERRSPTIDEHEKAEAKPPSPKSPGTRHAATVSVRRSSRSSIFPLLSVARPFDIKLPWNGHGNGDGPAPLSPSSPTSTALRSPSRSVVEASPRSPSRSSSKGSPEKGIGQGSEVEETVFVNAANAPTGKRGRDSEGHSVPFGGMGFQAVIVDMEH